MVYNAFNPAVGGYFFEDIQLWQLNSGVKAVDVHEQSWYLFSSPLFPTLMFFSLSLLFYFIHRTKTPNLAQIPTELGAITAI